MTGNPTIDRILAILNMVVILGAAGLVFYSNNMIKKPAVNPEDKFSQMAENAIEESQKELVMLPEQVINLYSRERRLRFLNLIVNLEPFESKQTEAVNEVRPIIIDGLIDIASQMKPDEVNSVTGRMTLETRLKKHVNDFVGGPLIKKVYFSKFIVQ